MKKKHMKKLNRDIYKLYTSHQHETMNIWSQLKLSLHNRNSAKPTEHGATSFHWCPSLYAGYIDSGRFVRISLDYDSHWRPHQSCPAQMSPGLNFIRSSEKKKINHKIPTEGIKYTLWITHLIILAFMTLHSSKLHNGENCITLQSNLSKMSKQDHKEKKPLEASDLSNLVRIPVSESHSANTPNFSLFRGCFESMSSQLQILRLFFSLHF